ncbi:hypothetical protein ACHAXR_006322 [Thalassiosira sp. AJA248-18]
MSSSSPSRLGLHNPPASQPHPNHNAEYVTHNTGVNFNRFVNIASYPPVPTQFNNFAMGGVSFYPSAPFSVGNLRQTMTQPLTLTDTASTPSASETILQKSPSPSRTTPVSNGPNITFDSDKTECNLSPDVAILVSRSNDGSDGDAVIGEDGYVGCADDDNSTSPADDENSTPPFWKGQRFDTVEIFDAKDDLSGRHPYVEICGLCLTHSNGCKGKGSDELINECICNCSGRKYSLMALGYLQIQKEVKSGRYTTDNVLSWLNDQGIADATLEEATNLRYRLSSVEGSPHQGLA